MPRASLNLHWHAWSRFETRLPSIQPSLQSLRIFRSRPRVSSINFKAALDATCNTFSGALTDAWPLFPPWSARGTNPFNKPLPFDVSTNKKPGWKSSWSIELPVSRAHSQVISSFLLSFFPLFSLRFLFFIFYFFFPYFLRRILRMIEPTCDSTRRSWWRDGEWLSSRRFAESTGRIMEDTGM